VYWFLQGKGRTLRKADCIVCGVKASLTFIRPSSWNCTRKKQKSNIQTMKFTVKQKSRLPKQVNSIAHNAARKLNMELMIA